ncbi:hypothetical protein DUI87_10826 [Hirundo rustica rustica]|uniref:Uncharacterized protein n=1 Tax=Hirundo rustica rustica TaxID=333673 RepID=A0A3M0KKX5_HIRRU|nr:hypothetical protein DUI87_10826 [Hirundo rustica rustica]
MDDEVTEYLTIQFQVVWLQNEKVGSGGSVLFSLIQFHCGLFSVAAGRTMIYLPDHGLSFYELDKINIFTVKE